MEGRWAAVWADGELYYQWLEGRSNLTYGTVLWYASKVEVHRCKVADRRANWDKVAPW